MENSASYIHLLAFPAIIKLLDRVKYKCYALNLLLWSPALGLDIRSLGNVNSLIIASSRGGALSQGLTTNALIPLL